MLTLDISYEYKQIIDAGIDDYKQMLETPEYPGGLIGEYIPWSERLSYFDNESKAIIEGLILTAINLTKANVKLFDNELNVLVDVEAEVLKLANAYRIARPYQTDMPAWVHMASPDRYDVPYGGDKVLDVFTEIVIILNDAHDPQWKPISSRTY